MLSAPPCTSARHESLKRLLNAVSLISSAQSNLTRNRPDVRLFLRDYALEARQDCNYILFPAGTSDPILAQFATELDQTWHRRKLKQHAQNVLGRPPLPSAANIRKYVRIVETGESGDDFSPTLLEASVARTQPEEVAYPGEVEVTEDFAERFHAPLFVKLFLFVILFDLDFQYLTLLMIVFVLHIHGVFEPLLRLFGAQRRPQDPLDRVLQNLQQRREAAVANRPLVATPAIATRATALATAATATAATATAATASTEPVTADPATAELTPDKAANNDDSSARRASDNPQAVGVLPGPSGVSVLQANAGGLEGSPGRNTEASPSLAELGSSAERKAPDHATRDAVGDAGGDDGAASAIPRLVLIFYQSVIMFIGTLLPWWTPDQRYLV